MGFMTGSGCLSRVLGPVFVTYVYQEYGTVWTFGMTSVMMAISLVWLWYFEASLEPQEPKAALTDQELQPLDISKPINSS